MPNLLRSCAAGAALLCSLVLGACGESEPTPDPAAIDQHLNKIIRDEAAEKNRLIEEARDREEVREREMEQREANYSAGADLSNAGNAGNTASD